MIDDHPDVNRLLAEAAELPAGPVQVELLAEAARIADAHNDVKSGFLVRRLLMDAALTGGQPDRLTVAFTWCVAQSDRDPQTVPPDEILWQYRWVISNLPQFPDVPRVQIEDAIADMTARYRAAGSTLRPVHLLRLNTAIKLRDPDLAAAAHRDWQGAARDHLSDDPRTEQSFVVDYLVFVGRHQEAVDMCPQVMSGRVDDPHFFGTDSAELLVPLLNLGRVADAVRVQRSGFRYVAKKHRHLDMIGEHVAFLSRLDNFAPAVKAFEEHSAYALATKQFIDRFDFFWGALVLVERLRRAGHETFKLRLPKEIPVEPRDRRYDLADLAAWLRADLAALGAKFDARNGNTYFADRLASAAELAARPAPPIAPARSDNP
jgi:hypothetical protein